MDRDIGHAMLTPDATQDIAGKRVQSSLLSLPAEIRNMIFGYIVIPLGKVVWLRGSGAARVSTHPVHTALLRTSRQLYQEASTLLYGRTLFLYDWVEYEICTVGKHSPSNVPLKLVQNLEVTFFTSYPPLMSMHGVCRFLKALADQQCSFNRLALHYDHSQPGEDDLLGLKSPNGAKLLELTCAVGVRKELEINFFYGYYDDGTRSTMFKDHIKDIAKGKSWIATPYYDAPMWSPVGYDPEYTLRYLFHPGQATLSSTP